jgi:PAS domain S-box-containing protein
MTGRSGGTHPFLAGGGEVAALIADRDWGATSLGPIEGWPQSVKSATALMLRSPVPMVMLWGADGVMLYNDAYSVFAGGRHPRLLGSRVREGWPEVADFNDHVMRVGLAGGTLAYRDQELTLHRHGRPEQVWMNLDYSPLIDESGEPAGVLAIVVETTGRKVAEASLAESEARFRNMADHAPVMMWVTDVGGSCTYRNRRWHDFTRQTAADALGVGWMDAIHPEDRERASEIFLAANASQAPFRLEYRLRRADGQYRWAIDAAAPRFGEDGPFAGHVGSVIDIEDRREADLAREAASSRAEALAAQQAAILGQLAEGVIVTDRAGRITFVNAAAARIHGVARLDVEPDAYSETYHLLDLAGRPHPPLELPLARAVRNGETVSDAAWRIQRPDGSMVLAVGSARPVLDGTGEQIGAVLTLRDDTQRAAAEDLVRESEARLRALTDNLPSGMVFQIASAREGVERRFVYVSQSNEKLTGVPAADVLADPGILYGLILPEHRPAMLEAEAKAVRDRTPFDVQVQFRRMDGEVRWSRIISAPREQADGSLVWDGLQIDITEQKHAEEELREWNERLESRVVERTAERDRMWSTSPDLMLIVGFDGVFLRVNPAWTAVLGYRDEDLVGHHFSEFVVAEDHDRTVDSVALAAAGGRPRIENRYRHRDGSIRWISWVAAPAGEVTYATGRDITAEKARQAELEAAQEALRQSQKMEAVGQLTGGLAHDFNNLLAAISGSFEMLARKQAAGRLEELERYLQLGQQATRKAAALTHRLLAFSRRQTLEPKLFSVERLVSGLEELIRRTIGPAIEVRVVAATGNWNVYADPLQLENALLNLCINARDAMPTGGRLVIETASRSVDASSRLALDLQPGPYVSLCVSDNGVGMRRTSWHAPSIRSSRRSRSAKAPASGSPWSTASPSSREGTPASSPRSGRGRPCACTCLATTRATSRSTRRHRWWRMSRRRPRAGPSSSSTTRRWCASWWPRRFPTEATTCWRQRPAPKRSRCCGRSLPSTC